VSTVASRREDALRRSLGPVWAAVLLVGGALVAWIVTVERMRGMDEGPGTHLGGLGWYLGVWVTMTAAMMLPSATPAALDVARASRGLATVLFAAGYLALWTAYGLTAYGLYRMVTAFDTGWLAWDRAGPYVVGGTIVAAGIYELTPLKTVLFAIGVMSIFWMAVVAGVIFAQKVLPFGMRLPRAVAAALVALGIWVAVSPSSVPWLTEPDQAPIQMKMEMS
jgi:predicted metal-binding membrane protein